MPMPRNLVLVRHGESEGNIATHRSKRGDDSAFSEEFRNRHSSMWRLSDLGREQAREAGEWIRGQFGESFHRFYTSEYLRAMETSSLLGFKSAEWFADFYLRERNWGKLDTMPVSERQKLHADAMKEREMDSFYWVPPNGESMAVLCQRVDRVLDTLHRECDGKNVIIVCHGEVMWAFRVRLERMSQARFRELDLSRNPQDRIHNCQILHYTRSRSPDIFNQDVLLPYLNWVRSVCPWDTDLSSNNWQQIVRPRYSSQELGELVAKTEPVVV